MKEKNKFLTAILAVMLFIPATAWSGLPELTEICGSGFLENFPGGKIVHVKGEPYEMGFQYGYMLGHDLNELIPLMKEKVCEEYDISPTAFEMMKGLIVKCYEPFFPGNILEELEGIYAGADLRVSDPLTFDPDDLIMVNAVIDAMATFDLETFACCGFAAWGPLTEGGKVFSTRNIDLFTGLGLEDYTLVSIIKEKGKIPVANIGYAGFIGCVSGMSGLGMSFAQIWGYSEDKKYGTPWPLTTRKILQNCITADDAVAVFSEAERTYGSNFVFSDAIIPSGVSIETTGSLMAHFYDNDPAEQEAQYNGECYAVRIPNAVFRASVALDPEIRSHQTSDNGPDGDPRESSAYKKRYKGQADEILYYRDNGIPIGADEAINISRKAAMRGSSMQCVAYAGSDLEFWVANSYVDEFGEVYDAWEQPYNHVDFKKYLGTADIELNQSSYTAGDRFKLNLRTTNLGPAANLDLYFAGSIDNHYFFYPEFTETPVPLRVTLEQYEYDRSRIELAFDIDAGMPSGSYGWLAVLVDTQDGRIVDIHQKSFRIND